MSTDQSTCTDAPQVTTLRPRRPFPAAPTPQPRPLARFHPGLYGPDRWDAISAADAFGNGAA